MLMVSLCRSPTKLSAFKYRVLIVVERVLCRVESRMNVREILTDRFNQFKVSTL